MRRPRHLSPEEQDLWERVADRAKPLGPARRIIPVKNPIVKTQPKLAEVVRVQRFQVGELADFRSPHDVLPSIGQRLAKAPVQMDAKAFAKLKRGKLRPEARLDLHGMTMSEAHPELIAFILGSQAKGRRLVLVITGKGKLRDEGGPMPARQGILRHQVPQWMAIAPLAQSIMQVTPAHGAHGGHGAYYVYLRRS